jgi:hypothetical protein
MPKKNQQDPVLLLTGPNPQNPFAGYLSEILAMEGYFCAENWDVSKEPFPDDLLQDRPLAILANVPLSDIQIAALKSYVASGGNLIASRPPVELAEVFGLKPLSRFYTLARNRFIVINHSDPLMAGFPAEALQFMGDSEVYEPDGARVLAWLSALPDKHPPYAAVTFTRYGEGQASLFSYDIGQTVVTLHQGLPDNASTGPNANADRSGMFKTSSLNIGVLDERQKMIPQADLHQDILVRLIRTMTESSLPLIRVWHFPNREPSAAFLNGDSDGMEKGDLLRVLDLVERYRAHYTVFLMKEHFDQITADVLDRLRKMGHDLGPHPWAGPTPSLEEMKKEIEGISSSFEGHFGQRASSLRTHCCVWVGWAHSARYMAASGLRMDTSFVAGRYYQEGFTTGSGLPFKFVGESGEVIDLYEQSTIETDDGSFTSKMLLPPLTPDEAVEHSMQMIDRCVNLYHSLYHPYFHPRYTREDMYGTDRLEKVLGKLRSQRIMTVSARDWVEFNDARRALHVSLKEMDPEKRYVLYSLRSPRAISGATLMIPLKWRNAEIGEVKADGLQVELSRVNWEGGLRWGLFDLTLEEGQEVGLALNFRPQP